ncbi:MAG: hypothetical protein CSYNP_00021 [Syntrophus sp. SKADARSKE-3]|nr:hypothetical protein [Syntrophus sp. SKADARSKE-3]
MKKAALVVLFNLLAIFLILAFFEGAMYYLVRHPDLVRRCPKGIRNTIGYLYATGDRRVIQFLPECSRHDNEVGYTLKPGSCTFTATEFSNLYRINRHGLRDDEIALQKPEIIVAGDSYAMGWGVNQEDTFASVIAKKGGRKVLNTGIASYGTAREMMLLRRLDTSNMKFLIIQYCENDEDENRAFYQNGNHLSAMTTEEYDRYTAMNLLPQDYYAGKYIFLKLEKKWKEFKKPKAQSLATSAEAPMDDVDLFINAVLHGPVDLSKVQVITLEAVGKDDFDRYFIRRLTEKIKTGNYPPPIKNMMTLDITKVIKKDDYYVLDDHWRKSGHEAIGGALLKMVHAAAPAGK